MSQSDIGFLVIQVIHCGRRSSTGLGLGVRLFWNRISHIRQFTLYIWSYFIIVAGQVQSVATHAKFSIRVSDETRDAYHLLQLSYVAARTAKIMRLSFSYT